MSNPHRGEVTVEADGRTWTLKLGANALIELEQQLGGGLAEKLQDEATSKVLIVRSVIWAAARKHHPDITEERAGELIDDIGLTEAMDLVQKLFAFAMGVKTGDGSPPSPNSKAAAGKRKG